MISADGIEVYLKPIGGNGDRRRFPELELSPGNDDSGHCKNCFVPWTSEKFQIVIKFPDDFKMYTASVVHTGIGFRKPSLDNSVSWIQKQYGTNEPLQYFVHRDVQVPGLQFCRPRLTNTGFAMGTVDENQISLDIDLTFRGVATNEEYEEQLGAGAVVVSIQRGRIEWTVQKELFRQQDIIKSQPDYSVKNNSFIPGTFKSLYNKDGEKYRFEFRPRSQSRLTEIKTRLLHMRMPDPPERIITEENQSQVREDPKSISQQEHTDLVDPSKDVQRETVTQIHSFALVTPDSELGKQTSEGEQSAWAKEQLSRQTSSKQRRSTPPTCDCPKETHGLRRSVAQNSSEFEAKSRKSTKTQKSKPKKDDTDFSTRFGEDAHSNSKANTDANETRNEKTAETIANACGRCFRYRKPPHGKKLAWRSRTKRWMYVARDAPDEVAPDFDRDDQEAFPRKISALREKSQANEHEPEDEPNDNIAQSKKVDAANAGSVEGDSEDNDLNTVPELTRQHMASKVTQATVEAGTSKATRMLSSVASPQTTDVTQQQIPHTPQTAATNVSRFDVDLTAEDEEEDEIMVIKSETVVRPEREGNLIEQDDSEDLHHRLDQLQRQKRMLEIDEEQAEIKRKLAKRQDRKRKPTAVTEIKMED